MELSGTTNQEIKVAKLSFESGSPPLQHYNKNLFSSNTWLRLLADYYNYNFWQTQSEDDEGLIVAEARCLVGSKLISLPFSDYVVPAVKRGNLPGHIESLHQKFPDKPLILKLPESYAKPEQVAFLGEPIREDCLHHVPVVSKPERRMSAGFRRNIRKAVKNGLEFYTTQSDSALKRFYHQYYLLRTEKLGVIPQPFSFFEAMHQRLIATGHGFYSVVSQAGSVLAMAIIIEHQKNFYYKWGCSRQDTLGLRPNNLLFFQLLHHAQEKGVENLDLGISSIDETRGLIRFKRAMGGMEQSVYTYKQLPENYPDVAEEKLHEVVNQMAGLVVQHKLSAMQTQSFSRALYPLFN
jgi:hypothetical protein